VDLDLTIECAWCRKLMGTKKCENWNETLPPVTHSICQDCQDNLRAQADRLLDQQHDNKTNDH
jgi:hypothetical protein